MACSLVMLVTIKISGGAGVDQLSGNLGDDILEGRAGNDVIDGGAGTDRGVFVHGTQAISAKWRRQPRRVCC